MKKPKPAGKVPTPCERDGHNFQQVSTYASMGASYIQTPTSMTLVIFCTRCGEKRVL